MRCVAEPSGFPSAAHFVLGFFFVVVFLLSLLFEWEDVKWLWKFLSSLMRGDKGINPEYKGGEMMAGMTERAGEC